MRKFFKSIVLATSLSFLATLVQADESGEITVTISGEDQYFKLDSKQSDWGGGAATGGGMDLMIPGIFGRAADEKTREQYALFSLSFEMWDDEVSSQEAILARRSGDTLEYLFANAKKGNLLLEITDHGIDGDQARVSGTFTANMGITKNYGRDVDLSDPVAISGSFTAVLDSN